MIVKLKIEEDAELRAAIKDAIRGQVLSIGREEILNILKEAVGQKTVTVNPDQMLIAEIKAIVKAQLDNAHWNKPSFIQEEARKEVQKVVKEIMAKSPLT